ncbi:haloacid dehalogenase, type II [Kwoniella shandongensis]|uniref:Haloacid dehalogenase, type II n=1 Tax=Kwoniella shandongensis TaxID=1734106 RepID=A0A5M6BS35_9TREE|nr:haloacid dehalogenase, type II [Kwoniella shandongensis]KAA5525623.1 haloacid dehalogenase, type II [Kwoniella shandongensis]
MTLTVCFDALGTCFTLEQVTDAVDETFGDRLRAVGFGSKGFVMDWFHSCQRDYTYLSLSSPPPPPIAKLLTTSLPIHLSTALNISPSSLPSLENITDRLSSLVPAPTLPETFSHLHKKRAKLIIVTNGSKSTTEGYASQAGIKGMVEKVLSCDDIGLAKPHKEVYEAALKAVGEVERGREGERWFVAAHLWDLAAAKKAGFKTALVINDIPATALHGQDQHLDAWYELYGGRPDLVGSSLLELAQGITEDQARRLASV